MTVRFASALGSAPRRTVAAAALLALSSAARAQTTLEWIIFHNGPTNYSDMGRYAAVDAAGNCFVAGQQFNQITGFPPPPPMADFAVVKVSPAGVKLWTKAVDPLGGTDSVFDLAIGPAGEVYMTGYCSALAGGIPVLIKLDNATGTVQWNNVYALPGFGRQIAFDSAGNPYLVGHAYTATTDNDVLVVKYNPAGGIVWDRTIDGGANLSDNGYAIHVLPSGEVLVAGGLAQVASQDFAVIKLDPAGNTVWTAAVDGGFGGTDSASVLAVDGSKVLAGGWRGGANDDWMMAQIDLASGSFDWTRFYAGPGGGVERVRSVAIDGSGVRWIAGASSSVASGIDFGVVRYDAAGTLLSTHTWNNSLVNYDDQPMKLLIGNAGQAWLCGYSYQTPAAPFDVDVQILQYDHTGAFDWARKHTVGAATDDKAFEAELAPGNKLFLAGLTNGSGSGNTDFLAMSVDLNDAPQAYCTAKINTLGCSPSLTFTGSSSAAASSGFTVECFQVRNQKNGLLFYGVNGPNAAPFQGGTMCVQAPTARTPIAFSGGSPAPADDCSGVFAVDMNAYAASGAGQPALSVPGTAICCQEWSRDPGASFQTSLSNALRYVVLP
jgi:hypothetical protein